MKQWRIIEFHAAGADVFCCPYLMKTRERTRGNAAWRQIIHNDVDNGLELAKVRKMGGFVVWSGSSGHAHVYVPLAYTVRREQHERLCEGLRGYLGGDDKIRDNDLLRPAGSFNFKPTLQGTGRTGESRKAMSNNPLIGGPGADPLELAKLFGIDINAPSPPNGSQAPPADTNAREQVDLTAYPSVQDALDNPVLRKDGSVDRSKTTYSVVAACGDAGLIKIEQMRWAVDQDPGLKARIVKFLARTPPKDDVW